MSGTVKFDTREWEAYADDLTRRTTDAANKLTPVVSKGALNIKTEMRALAGGIGPHARAFPYSITYDLTGDRSRVVALIGPDKNIGQGALGHILIFGSSRSGPHDILNPPLEHEAPRYISAIETAAKGLLL